MLLLDISMPDMDGYELLATIRRRPALRDVPAVAVTVYASDQDRQCAAKAGFDMHVSKPFDADALVDTVARLVGSAS